MKRLVMKFFFLIGIFGITSACGSGNENKKYEELSELDFGKGTYRPTPFNLDEYPPFKWMGLPDTVVKSSELKIEFNEDAIRSNSTATIFFIDSNGNSITYIEGGNVKIEAKEGEIVIPLIFKVDPSVGDSILTGSVMVVSDGVDFVNQNEITPYATQIGTWKLHHKIGINWWRWILLIFIFACLLGIVYFIFYGLFYVLKFTIEAISHLPRPQNPFKRRKFRRRRDDDEDEEDEQEEGHGHRIDPGSPNTKYIIHKNYIIPNGSQHKNPRYKTNGQLLAELGDTKGIIKIKNNKPIFDKDGGTSNGKPLEVFVKDGIEQFLKPEELHNGKNINRNKLHDEVFRRIAKKYDMDEDVLQVFKGNSAPIEKLMNKWHCSEEDVWRRCGNRHRIARVLHECEDGKTVQLVPWVYHHISHSGGIEAVASRYK